MAAIDGLPGAPAIYRGIYVERLAPAVGAAREGRFADAHALYRGLVHKCRDRFGR
jgi:hypothetical protein